MNQPKERIEDLLETAEATHQDGALDASLPRRARLSPTWMVVVLLVVLSALAAVSVVRLGQLIDRTDSLIVEQQRATCYERLQWLGDPFDDHPERDDLRAGAARTCEGDTPVTAFEDNEF